MSHSQTVGIPQRTIQRLHEVLSELEEIISPYKPEFLAKMYRARASDLEGRGRSLTEMKRRFRGK